LATTVAKMRGDDRKTEVHCGFHSIDSMFRRLLKRTQYWAAAKSRNAAASLTAAFPCHARRGDLYRLTLDEEPPPA
jgi:hypothetical protein